MKLFKKIFWRIKIKVFLWSIKDIKKVMQELKYSRAQRRQIWKYIVKSNFNDLSKILNGNENEGA